MTFTGTFDGYTDSLGSISVGSGKQVLPSPEIPSAYNAKIRSLEENTFYWNGVACQPVYFVDQTTDDTGLSLPSFGLFDHFTGTSLDTSQWTPVTGANGTISMTGDGYVEFDTPATTDSAFIYHNQTIDTGVSQMWMFCFKKETGSSMPNFISLMNPSSGSPSAQATGDVMDQNRISIGMWNTGDPNSSIFIRYDADGDGTGQYWGGDPVNGWGSKGDLPGAAIGETREGPDEDWYVVGIEIDAETGNNRFRAFGMHQALADITDHGQGWCITALTDFVDFTGFTADFDNLHLCIGDQFTDAYTGHYDLEWVRSETGEAKYSWVNSEEGFQDYRIELLRSYGSTWLPLRGRGIQSEIELGTAGQFDDGYFRKRNIILKDGVYHMFYEAFSSTGTFDDSEVGLQTGTSVVGPWQKYASNPIITQQMLGTGADTYGEVTAPFPIVDLEKEGTDEAWKLQCAGENGAGVHRIFMFKAPDPEGPWVMVTGTGPDGSILGETSDGTVRDDGCADPYTYWDPNNSVWKMYYSAYSERNGAFQDPVGWSVNLAESTDLITWNTGAGVIFEAGSDPLRGFTAFNGKIIEMSNTTIFENDDLVIIRNAGGDDNWAMSRIRKKGTNYIELYHEVATLSVGADSAVAKVGSGSITPHAIVDEPGGIYRMYCTSFQPFIFGSPTSPGNHEMTVSYTGATKEGPWVQDKLTAYNALPHIWEADNSHENMVVTLSTVRAVASNTLVTGESIPIENESADSYTLQITPDLGALNPEELFEPYVSDQQLGNPYLKQYEGLQVDVDLTGELLPDSPAVHKIHYTIPDSDFRKLMSAEAKTFLWRVIPIRDDGIEGQPSLIQNFLRQVQVTDLNWTIDPTDPTSRGLTLAISGTKSPDVASIEIAGTTKNTTIVSSTRWTAEIPLTSVATELQIRAIDFRGNASPYKLLEVALPTDATDHQLVWNTFDEFGYLVDLRRLPEEGNSDYRRRVLDVYKHRSGPRYKGLVNGVTRELDITYDDVGLTVLPGVDSVTKERVAGVHLEISTNYVSVDSDRYETKSEYHELDSWEWSIELDQWPMEDSLIIESPLGNQIESRNNWVLKDKKVLFKTDSLLNKPIYASYRYRSRFETKGKTVSDVKTWMDGLEHSGVSIVSVDTGATIDTGSSADYLALLPRSEVIDNVYLTFGGDESTGLPVRWSNFSMRVLADPEYTEANLDTGNNTHFGTHYERWASLLQSQIHTQWGFLVADRNRWSTPELPQSGHAVLQTVYDPKVGYWQGTAPSGAVRYNHFQAYSLNYVDPRDGSDMTFRGIESALLRSGIGDGTDLLVKIVSEDASQIVQSEAEFISSARTEVAGTTTTTEGGAITGSDDGTLPEFGIVEV